MRNVLLCCSLALVASGAAFAQGEGEGEGEACGAVTLEGECQGTDAVWCQDNVLQRVTCADLLGDGSVVGSCEVYTGFGSWCAFNDGDPCAFQTQDGNAIYFACANDSSGCVDGQCTAGTGACTPDADPQNPTVTCLDGGNLQIGCQPWAQAFVYTCAGISAASTCANDVCGNVGSGDPCADGIAECGGGLSCGADNTCGGGGEGEGEPAEGEGEGDNGECASDRDCDEGEICDNGECTGGGEQPPVCSHTATSAGLPAAGLLALGGLVIGVRRRRRA
ncbi:MAG: hypothetical protein HYS27_09995 [Deltaproteobacteria bacterium]|nr:hypothetical protein [Deltaproteobacteria bacterium]